MSKAVKNEDKKIKMEVENNPLTEEQIKELNEIASLPIEQQRERLGVFLKTLNPEQIEYLKKMQGQGQECLFCSIIDKKIESHVVYEDNEYIAVLDINPGNKGHVLVMPKEHIAFSTQVEDAGKLFNAANKIAKKIYDVFKTGTNIFVANGTEAGQRLNHLVVHVIPRFQDDGINFAWKGKKIEESELKEMMNKLRIEDEIEQKKPIEIVKKQEEQVMEINELRKKYDSWFSRIPY